MVKLNEKYISAATMIGASMGLHYFWIFNVLKEAYPQVKEGLTLYTPVGPLLGLFVISLVAMALVTFAAYFIVRQKADAETVERESMDLLIVSTILFFFLVFPPIFEPLVDILAG